MFESLLLKLLGKIAEEVGARTSSLILDEKSWTKRTSFDLYRSLRNLEETLTETEDRLSNPFDRNWSSDKGEYVTLNRYLITTGFVQHFANNLEEAQEAFEKIDDKIEIYGSRENMDKLRNLLGLDAEAMFLLNDDYNYNRYNYTIDQWRELITNTREAASKARNIISEFIASKFPI